jgi:alpha-tubulin suppressor-like RCC1 family protein
METHIMPRQLDFGDNVKIVKVACGSAHTIALSTVGLVYSWGFGESGCLGLGHNIFVTHTPQKLTFVVDD